MFEHSFRTYYSENFNILSLVVTSIIFFYWILPLFLKCIAKFIIKKIVRLDVNISKLGYKSLALSISRENKVLLSIKINDICIVPILFSKGAKTYLSLNFNEILIEDVSINRLSELFTQTSPSKYHNKKSRINWLIPFFKFITFNVKYLKVNFKLADLERPPQIILLSNNCEFFIVPDKNYYMSQLKLDDLSCKVICPNLSDSNLHLLANLKTIITFDFVFLKKPKLSLHKFFLTVGETKLAVLEEIFHELAQITKHNVTEPISYIETVKGKKKPRTLSSYFKWMPKELGIDIGKLEMSLIRLSVSRNLNVTWTKCYGSLLQPDLITECTKLSEQNSLDFSSSWESVSEVPENMSDEAVKFKTGCYGLNISRSMSTATSWRRVELTGQMDTSCGSVWLKCRVDNPCLIINIDELVFWRELAIDAQLLFNQLRSKQSIINTRIESNSNEQSKLDSWPQVHYGLKLEVNCSHRGQSINADSQAVIQIVNNSLNAVGLEFGLKTLVASYEADSSCTDPEKFLQSIDLYSDINTGYCRLLSESVVFNGHSNNSNDSKYSMNFVRSSITNTSPSHNNQYIDYFHKWDTIGFTGNVFLWLHRNRAGCLMNQVQLECSPLLITAITHITDTLYLLHASSVLLDDSSSSLESPMVYDSASEGMSVHSEEVQDSSTSLWRAVSILDLEMKLEHVDIFCVSSSGAFLRQKVCIIQLNKNHHERMDIYFKSCYMNYDVIIDKNELYSTTIHDESIKLDTPDNHHKFICSIDQIKMEYYPEYKNMTLFCDSNINFQWNMAIHLTIVEFYDALFGIVTNINRLQIFKQSSMKSKVSTEKRGINLLVECQSNFKINMQLTNNKEMAFFFDSLTYMMSNERAKFTSNDIVILCDEQPIFRFENFSWRSIVPTNKYRKDIERLKLTDACNRAWEIQADRFLISFPYKYNFNECYTEFVTVRKFIKEINKTRKRHIVEKEKENSDDDKFVNIPPDYIVYFKEFQVELKDDPFECQLLDNYLVLKDESEEHEKRIIRLRTQLRKMMRSGRNFKEAEYNKCLNQLDLQKQNQYMTRISSIRAGNNNNSNNNLLRWTIHNLSLMSLSDSDFYGDENALRHLKSIDVDSPYPQNGVEFSTLWCRMINLNVDFWVLQMRDYTKAIWEIKDMYVWGRLIFADQISNDFAKRKVSVKPGAPWKDYTIERSIGVIKFFHDFGSDMREHTICYGPNWEPCMQWINQSLERINRPSRDPSPPIPWWDKSRLRLHGRLYFLADLMNWYYPVSLDPFNTTEFFQWQWANVKVNWENMKWILDGDLSIFCRSGSKYDGDCQLLHWPNLKLNIGIEWICFGDPNDHFSIQPIYSENVKDASRHDTYYKFRSRNVNLSIELKESRQNTKEHTRCVFYTNILKFFEKFKYCVRKVARPIRRGKYFQYSRKRKIPLGRHFKFVNLKMVIPQLNLVYWISLAKKSGVHMICGPLTLSSCFKLDLVPYEGILKRRAASNWTVVHMKCHLKAGRVWLLMENATGSNMTREETPLHQGVNIYNTEYDSRDLFHNKHRFEFMIISNLRYDRVSESKRSDFQVSYNSSILNDSSENNFEGLIPRHNLKLVDMRVRWTETNRNLVYSMIDIYRHKTQLRKNLSAQALKSIQLHINPTPQPPPHPSAPSNTTTNHPNPTTLLRQTSITTNNNNTIMSSGLIIPEEKFGSESNISILCGSCVEDNNLNYGSVGEFNLGVAINQHQRKRSISAHCISSESKDKNSTLTPGSNIKKPIGGGLDTNPMLEQLVREADTARVYAYCDEEPEVGDVVDKLMGVQLSNSNPKVAWNWHLELINSQVMLKTDQLAGYVIVSAGTTRLDSYDHLPLWKDSQLLTKSSLCGKLECMQYYATVGKVNPSSNQQWLNTCDVEDHQLVNEDVLSGTPEVVGCGKAVGGVVSGCVGPVGQSNTSMIGNSNSDNNNMTDILSGSATSIGPNQEPVQLQRMISKCSCNVYYINYDIADPNVLPQNLIPPLPLEEDELASSAEGSTVLTIVHSNLNVCTNSLQYHMVVDIINDLILYVEPHRKARDDRYKVEFSLFSMDQLKHTILHSQESLRNLVHYQMKLERELWRFATERQWARIKMLESTIKQVKTDIEQKNSALTQCIAIYQQWYVQAQRKYLHLRSITNTGPVVSVVGSSQPTITLGNNGVSCNTITNTGVGVSTQPVVGVGASGGRPRFDLEIGDKLEGHHYHYHAQHHYHHKQSYSDTSQITNATTISNATNTNTSSTSSGGGGSGAGLGTGGPTATAATQAALKSTGAPRELRRHEVCFEHATWRMTENDGQIGLCDVELRGFIYNKLNYDDDDYLTGRHTFELATVKVESLINMSVFREVLTLDTDSLLCVGGPVLRIYVNEGVPVGGIKVNQSIEISIAPLVLQISKLFYSTMMPFFFPGKNESTDSTTQSNAVHSSTSAFVRTTTSNGSTNSSITTTNTNIQDNANVQVSTYPYAGEISPSTSSQNMQAYMTTTASGQDLGSIVEYDEHLLQIHSDNLIQNQATESESTLVSRHNKNGSFSNLKSVMPRRPTPSSNVPKTLSVGPNTNDDLFMMMMFPSPGSTEISNVALLSNTAPNIQHDNDEFQRQSSYGNQNLKIEDLTGDNLLFYRDIHRTQQTQLSTNTSNALRPPGLYSDSHEQTSRSKPNSFHQSHSHHHHHPTNSGSPTSPVNNPPTLESTTTTTTTTSSTTSLTNDPLQLMAERAKQNAMFHYVSISGFPIRLSYRGEKQNALSINNIALNVTQIQFHNKLWTWLDLVMEVKKSIYKQLKFEIIKQKFKFKRRPMLTSSNPSVDLKVKDDDIKYMLLGAYSVPERTNKKKPNLLKKMLSKK